jgi:myo-inositol-1-phosphate synthase
VSWANFVPTYIRNEVKKKTGIVLDERGNVVRKKGEQEEEEFAAAEQRQMKESVTKEKNYTPIKNYKPTGHLVYNPELFEKIEKKVSFV